MNRKQWVTIRVRKALRDRLQALLERKAAHACIEVGRGNQWTNGATVGWLIERLLSECEAKMARSARPRRRAPIGACDEPAGGPANA